MYVYLILWEQPLKRAPDIRMNRLSAVRTGCRLPGPGLRRHSLAGQARPVSDNVRTRGPGHARSRDTETDIRGTR